MLSAGLDGPEDRHGEAAAGQRHQVGLQRHADPHGLHVQIRELGGQPETLLLDEFDQADQVPGPVEITRGHGAVHHDVAVEHPVTAHLAELGLARAGPAALQRGMLEPLAGAAPAQLEPAVGGGRPEALGVRGDRRLGRDVEAHRSTV
jgi:hypothetical protein